jgi:hypothetical protein
MMKFIISRKISDLTYTYRLINQNRRNGEVGGGILYHKVYLSRGVAHTMLGTVILLYRCTLFQPLYTCTHGQLISLHSTATWRQSGLRFVNETSQGFTTQTPKAGYRGGDTPT